MAASFLEDIAATEPRFDFDLIAESLVPLLERPTEGALVLGIHGPWGSGKTTLLTAIRQALGTSQREGQRQDAPAPVFVDFNAWKFQEREALWRALIMRLLAELRPLAKGDAAQGLDELQQSLYRAFVVQEKGPWKVNWQSLITEVITIGLAVIHLDFVGRALSGSVGWITKLFPKKKDGDGLDEQSIEQLGSILERATTQRQVDQVQSIEQFLDKFRQVVEGIQATGHRIYVLVDDLDRCLPEDALDIFESIKLFLDAPGCVFLVALDRDVIRKGLGLRYGRGRDGQAASGVLIDPDEYIEKTISVSIDLPRLSDSDARSIIDEFAMPLTLSDANKDLLIAGLGTNPRRVKRFMNTLSFQLELARVANARGRHVPPGLLGHSSPGEFSLFLKLLLMSYRYSAVFAFAFEDQGILKRLTDIANKTGGDRRAERFTMITNEPRAVQMLANDEEFWELLRARPQFQADSATGLLRWFRRSGDATAAATPSA